MIMDTDNIINIWHIDSFQKLISFLKNSKDKYIVLGIVLQNTPDRTKIMMRKYMKNKSREYSKHSKILFLYYVVENEKYLTKANFLSKDLSEYPKMCHIFDGTHMMIEIKSIDNSQIMDESFQIMKEHYDKLPVDTDNFVNNVGNIGNTNNNNDITNHIPVIPKNSNNSNNLNMIPNSTNTFVGQAPIKNTITERKKLLEKLGLIKEKYDEATLLLLEECQKRKKEEEEN